MKKKKDLETLLAVSAFFYVQVDFFLFLFLKFSIDLSFSIFSCEIVGAGLELWQNNTEESVPYYLSKQHDNSKLLQ